MSGDINDAERKKRRLAVLTVSVLMLMAMVAAVAVGVTTGKRKRAMHDHAPGGGDGGHGGDHSNVEASHKAVKSICQPTDYRRMCKRTLSNTNSTDPRELIQTAFHAALENIEEVMKNSSSFKPPKNDTRTTWALETCKEVMEYAVGDLHRANDQMGEFDPNKLDDYVENMRVWLSGAINFQETCIDAFENTTGNIGDQMKQSLNNSQELTSNGLAMATQLVDFLRSMNISGLGDIKRLLSEEHGNSEEHGSPRGHGDFGEHGNSKEHDTTEKHDNSEKHGRSEEHHNSGEHGKNHQTEIGKSNQTERLPPWSDVKERKLMKLPGSLVNADVVVAKDGSGKYNRISEALKDAPIIDPNKLEATAPKKTFVIYIKEGVYEEEVRVERNMTHVMFIGDGPTKTKITGNRSFADGFVTYKTATVSIMGSNFIAKDIGFENSAGPEKGQAVALMVQSDMSIFYNCQIEGHRATLNAHSYRQFYRDCTISGTMDFIFGDAAGVFQNCKLVIRKPDEGQECSITAQERTVHKEATGSIFHNCTIGADPLAQPKCKAYLGRPSKKFSKVIVLQSLLDDSIAPEGWMPWMGNFSQDTCTFVEYENRGPGAVETGRVKWPGVKKIPIQEAVELTPGRFLGGDHWIAPTLVPYKSGLLHVERFKDP